MLQAHLRLQSLKPQHKQLPFLPSLLPINHYFFTTPAGVPQPPASSCTPGTSCSQRDPSADNFAGIAKSVISRCSHLWGKKGNTFINHSLKDSNTFINHSLKDYLLNLSLICPKAIRRFWRVSELKPQDVLEILLGFECVSRDFQVEAKKIESLYGIFKWARQQSADFEHFPQSCKIMASLLVGAGLFRDAQFLLLAMERHGVLLDGNEIYSNLIEGYIGDGEFERAISVYDHMKELRLVPSISCFRVILNFLVQKCDSQLALSICLDMVEMGFEMSSAEKEIYENVIQLLCRDGKIQEGRNLVKKVNTLGMKSSTWVLKAIASGYCKKKDYDDLISFFAEIKCAPGVLIGNMVIFSVCRNFGVERALLIMPRLENLGFSPNERTFGILIGWSCCEGKLKDAFIYLSKVLSIGRLPHIHSYNALISGLFKEGMWEHAQDILQEMDDQGIIPNMSTFQILLAGYCKARQFDEVKKIVFKMMDCGLVQLSPLEDPLTKAFVLLGFNPLAVKVRRDNNTRFLKAEFFDNLGNGLYLETDMDEYEKTLTAVLIDYLIPDFNSLILKECTLGNFRTAVEMVNELLQWGQELSLPALSALLNLLCESHRNPKAIINILRKIPILAYQLDQETLNLPIQAQNKKGFAYLARMCFGTLLEGKQKIKNQIYTALLMELCKHKDFKGLHNCWKVAIEKKWLPVVEDCKAVLSCLWQQEMFKEALELFECMMANVHINSDISHAFVQELCGTGFTHTAHVLVDELQKKGCDLDDNAYSHLIRGFCKEKRFSEASMILNMMLAKKLSPDLKVSVPLIHWLCRSGNFEQAVTLKEIILGEQPSISVSVHVALLNAHSRTASVGEMAGLFQDIQGNGAILDTAEVYNTMVQGYCQANNLRGAGELLGVMIKKNVSISISTYRSLVSRMCMEGRVSSALNLKVLVLQQSNYSSLIIYNLLIFYLSSARNTVLVDTLLNELKEKGLQLDGVTYNFVVYGFSRCNAGSKSLQYLTAMVSSDLRPSNRSLRAVISDLCRDGEFQKALKLSLEMESRGWNHGSIIQNDIVECLLDHGELQEAVNFLDRIVSKGLIPDNINYDNLIKQLCRQGIHDKAVELLDVMLKKGNIPNSTSYDSIIQVFCAGQKLDVALDFHTEMLNRKLKPNFNTWSVLVQKCCEDGRNAEAEKILDFMVQMGETPSREMYCSVIDRYRFENNFSKASKLVQAMQQSGHEPDFETHWSLISNFSGSSGQDAGGKGLNFLSRLLSGSGFIHKNTKAKVR